MFWDKSILKAKVVQIKPVRIVDIKARGRLSTKLVYKLEDKPNKTSLAMTETRSVLIKGGGGSWKYEPKGQGTLWTQTNTLILKDGFFYALLRPIITIQLKRNTINL